MKHKKCVMLSQNQVQKAIDALCIKINSIGSQKQFAEMIGTHQSQVSRWLYGAPIKAEKVIEIESLCGISREILRPDLFEKQ